MLRDFVGGRRPNSSRLGVGLGFRREWAGVNVVASRLEGMLRKPRWQALGNIRIKKAFDDEHDGVDIITSAGYQYKIIKGLLGRVEVVAEDLEGIRNSEEAEGGAKMLVGPSVHYQPAATPFNFTLSGGPALYLSKNKPAAKPKAGRELEKDVQNGYTLRMNVNYSF